MFFYCWTSTALEKQKLHWIEIVCERLMEDFKMIFRLLVSFRPLRKKMRDRLRRLKQHERRRRRTTRETLIETLLTSYLTERSTQLLRKMNLDEAQDIEKPKWLHRRVNETRWTKPKSTKYSFKWNAELLTWRHGKHPVSRLESDVDTLGEI